MVYINEGREDNFLNVLIKIIQKFFNKFDPTAKFCLTFVVGNCSRLRKFKRTIVRGYVRFYYVKENVQLFFVMNILTKVKMFLML